MTLFSPTFSEEQIEFLRLGVKLKAHWPSVGISTRFVLTTWDGLQTELIIEGKVAQFPAWQGIPPVEPKYEALGVMVFKIKDKKWAAAYYPDADLLYVGRQETDF